MLIAANVPVYICILMNSFEAGNVKKFLISVNFFNEKMVSWNIIDSSANRKYGCFCTVP